MPNSRMNGAAWALLAAAAGTGLAPQMAAAHPHIFAEARLEVALSDDGTVEELRNVWRFDPYFSATVLLEFDADGDNTLNTQELEAVGATVRESLADFSYYTSITDNGADVPPEKPEAIYADMKDGQLLLFFAVKPSETVKLDGRLAFGVYDPTMYTAMDFINDSDLVVLNDQGQCEKSIIRPNPDEIIAQNQQSLTDAFFNDPAGNDFSKLFATRLELTC